MPEKVLLTVHLKGGSSAVKEVEMPILPFESCVYVFEDCWAEPLYIANWVMNRDGSIECILTDSTDCKRATFTGDDSRLFEDEGFEIR